MCILLSMIILLFYSILKSKMRLMYIHKNNIYNKELYYYLKNS